MRRFPLRTLLLMVVALIAFVRLWIITHARQAPEASQAPHPASRAPVRPREPARPAPTPENAPAP